MPNRVIIVEQRLAQYGLQRKDRADIVVHRETEEGLLPIAVIGCKVNSVFISDATIRPLAVHKDIFFRLKH